MDGTLSAPLSRRGFLAAGAGLTFIIGTSGLLSACVDPDDGTPATLEPNIWVRIATDGTVTIQFPATEMGQGSMTSLPIILAEELDADWSKVVVETVAVHDTRYGNPLFGNLLYTAGSGAVQGYYMILRKAGAQARRMLMQSVADQFKLPLAELSTEPGHVVHAGSGRRVSYGEVAGLSQISLTVPEIGEDDLKSPADFRLIGHDLPRLDIPEKVDGSALYGIDVQVPGMVYAAIVRSPVEGESPTAVEESAARAVDGVSDIVRLDDAVAVVGDRAEAVFAAKHLLEITWSGDGAFRGVDSEATIADCLAQVRALDKEGVRWRDEGDAKAALASAERVVEAEYTSGYAYHAQMEPLNATASVSADGMSAEIWVGTQTQSLSVLGAARALGTSPDKITLHPLYLGGGFGRRSFFRQRYIDDALFLSKALGKPVKVMWTREDDVAFGAFRPAAAQLLRAALDAGGRVVAWHHRLAAPSVIANMNPVRWEQQPGQHDIITMNGADSPNYSVPDFLTEHVLTGRQARLCAWRAVGTSYTKFASESFVDEIAQVTGRDPLELRLELCREHPRAQAVLRRVADMAGWGEAREDGRALGMALANYKPGAVSAGIAEISLDRESGRIRVHKFWLAANPGTVISPYNTIAQLEGNIIFGLSASLLEDITVEDGRVVQSNFHDYPVLRMADVPEVEIDLMPDSGPPSAVGELGLATVPGAIANAFAVLTGKRLRRLAFTPDQVLKTLAG